MDRVTAERNFGDDKVGKDATTFRAGLKAVKLVANGQAGHDASADTHACGARRFGVYLPQTSSPLLKALVGDFHVFPDADNFTLFMI